MSNTTTDRATWEYVTVPLISHALQQILNQWGSEGWELVTVVENVAYFKRPAAGGAQGAGP